MDFGWLDDHRREIINTTSETDFRYLLVLCYAAEHLNTFLHKEGSFALRALLNAAEELRISNYYETNAKRVYGRLQKGGYVVCYFEEISGNLTPIATVDEISRCGARFLRVKLTNLGIKSMEGYIRELIWRSESGFLKTRRGLRQNMSIADNLPRASTTLAAPLYRYRLEFPHGVDPSSAHGSMISTIHAKIENGINWMGSSNNHDFGWGRTLTSETDLFSTADALLVFRATNIQPSNEKRILDLIRKGRKTSSEGTYWERRSAGGSLVASANATARILSDSLAAGESCRDHYLRSAAGWLYNKRSKEGYWTWTVTETDPSPVVTANAALALNECECDRFELGSTHSWLLENKSRKGDGWAGLSRLDANVGATAYVLMSLVNNGISTEDERIRSSFNWMEQEKGDSRAWYPDNSRESRVLRNTSWAIIAKLVAGKYPFRDDITRPVNWIVDQQRASGSLGWWSEGLSNIPSVRDTQDALLALRTFEYLSLLYLSFEMKLIKTYPESFTLRQALGLDTPPV